MRTRYRVLALALLLPACAVSGTVESSGCADVVQAAVAESADGTFRFDVTITSADTGWDKYADWWEVRLPDGTVAGTRELTHPHVDEQPFTRSLSGVVLPEGTPSVTIAAHDSADGFCGTTLDVVLGP